MHAINAILEHADAQEEEIQPGPEESANANTNTNCTSQRTAGAMTDPPTATDAEGPSPAAAAAAKEAARRQAEMEAKALAYAEEKERKRQELEPGQTLLDIEVSGGGKPTQVIIGAHPVARFNGTYQAQERLVNGYLYYKNENDMHLYFYDQAEGGQKGWSLDHREPDGIKDHYSGGWFYLKNFAYLDSQSDIWRAVP